VSQVTGVRFRRAGKVYFFDAGDLTDLQVGDYVIVDTVRGREAGQVVVAPDQVLGADFVDLKPIVRRADWEDLSRMAELAVAAPNVLARVRERITEHRLPMRAVLAEYNYDGTQLSIYFVSEERRVDFRVLVRDLARIFGTRVHLRQIGPRDQAKLLGGIDRCGRELCCGTWLPEFRPISVRMAKTQGLPLNPSEISGMCGKLLCCLAFENEQYVDLRRGLPKLGATLSSAACRGRVIDVNALTRRITVEWETGARSVIDADELAEQQERLAQGGPGPVRGGDGSGEAVQPEGNGADDADLADDAGELDDADLASGIGDVDTPDQAAPLDPEEPAPTP
jgi:cell fate regulator YaaT (PSP1 superfamily)